MSLYSGVVELGDKTRGASRPEKVGTIFVDAATRTVQTEENPYYELSQKVAKVAAVASLVAGTYNQREAATAVSKMDFENDEYLKEIGSAVNSSSAQHALDNYLDSTTFACEQAAKDTNVSAASGVMTASKLDADAIDKIKTTGTYECHGAVYDATLNADGTATLSMPSTVKPFEVKSPISVDMDPARGVASVQAKVTNNYLTATELDSIKSAGSFSRNGIDYQASFGGSSSEILLKASVPNGSPQYQKLMTSLNAPLHDVTTTMKGSACSRSQLENVAQSGTYNLGGMSFNPAACITGSSFNSDKYSALQSRADIQNADISKRYTSMSRKSQAEQLADIQRAGQNHILQVAAKDGNTELKRVFNGSPKSIRESMSLLNKQIAQARRNGLDTKALENQKRLIQQYRDHGGKVQSPTQNKLHHRGVMTVASGLLGQDMMQGVRLYTGVAKAAKTAYRGVAGSARKLSYMGSTAANRIIKNGMNFAPGGTGSRISTMLDNSQNKKTAQYQERKRAAQARRNGTYKNYKKNKRLEYRASKGERLVRKKEILDNKRTKLVAKGKNNGRNYTRQTTAYSSRMARIDRRKDRFDRFSKFKANTSERFRRIRHPLKNSRIYKRIAGSKLGKIAGAIFKAPMKLLNLIGIAKAWLKKVLAIAVGYYLAFFVIVLVIMIVVYYFTQWFSTGINTAKSAVHKVAQQMNDDINYQQMIVDVTTRDIATDFSLICQLDGTFHYMEKKNIPSEEYPWFLDVTMGEINHIWAWEESDNTSRYATSEDDGYIDEETGLRIYSGELMYGDSYIHANQRTCIDSVTLNMYPIAAMTHKRYYNELSFEEWETALGYTYYMFSVSHDIARYDTNYVFHTNRYLVYNDASLDPGYDYDITYEHKGVIYGAEGITWDAEAHYLTRPSEQCTNVYIHDFSPPGFESKIAQAGSEMSCWATFVNHNISRDEASTYSYKCSNSGAKGLQGLLEKIGKFGINSFRNAKALLAKTVAEVTRKPELLNDIESDSLDKGYTDVNSMTSLAIKKKSLKNISKSGDVSGYLSMTIEQLASTRFNKILDINPQISGVFIYDGSEESKPHAQPEATYDEVALNNLGAVCENAMPFQYGIYFNNGDEKLEDLWTNGLNGTPSEGGNCSHGAHEVGCFEVTHCTEGDTYNGGLGGGSVEIPNGEDEMGNSITRTHVHGWACVNRNVTKCGHDHEPWQGPDNPGCWKTVYICPGHCAGHLHPMVDVVEKVTYKGLADEDNFKTVYWLTVEEVTNAAGGLYNGILGWLDAILEDQVVTVTQFRSYWYAKASTWFSPLPRSPFSYYKKVSKYYIQETIEFLDSPAQYCENLWADMKSIAYDSLMVRYTCGYIQGQTEADGVTKHNHTASGCELCENLDELILANSSSNFENGVNHADEDMRQWDGWWQDENTFDASLNDELESHFGSWEEDNLTRAPIEWSTYGEAGVSFPQVGFSNVTFSMQQIEDLLNSLIGSGAVSIDELGNIVNTSNLSDTQITILTNALGRCGKFYYSLTGSGHMNGTNGTSGPSDCSGWVNGTINAALGTDYNYSAAGWASLGTYGGTMQPGSVIAHNNGGIGSGGASYTGHVMIYVGDAGDGNHYVADCTSGTGSSLRIVSSEYLAKYKYVFNP